MACTKLHDATGRQHNQQHYGTKYPAEACNHTQPPQTVGYDIAPHIRQLFTDGTCKDQKLDAYAQKH